MPTFNKDGTRGPANVKCCVDCKHSKLSGRVLGDPDCQLSMRYDLVSGEEVFVMCREMRGPSGLCSAQGDLWESDGENNQCPRK